MLQELLTIDDLKKRVPAAFAAEPSSNTSERYAFIPTQPLVEEIMSRGWLPVRASQSKRTQDQRHAQHMITFRDPKVVVGVGDTLPEVTLINAHNATKRFRLLAGFFRLICSNGMIVGTGIAETRVDRIHLDDANVDLDLAMEGAMNKLGHATEQIARWSVTELDWGSRQQFAREAVVIRNGGDAIWSNHFDPMAFLNRRRKDDFKNDLWTIFNVLQENLTKGGVMGVTRETRPITQVKEVVRINEDLWQLAEKYGNLHGRN